MTFAPAALIGFFLGFGFGVGCALAVMYSIYMGGYRAAVLDVQRPEAPDRLVRARKHVLAPAKNLSPSSSVHPSN